MPDIPELLQKNKQINIFDLEILLAHAINRERSFLHIHPDYELTFWENIKFNYYQHLYKKRLPVAYIVGHKEFYGLDFLVNKHTLVPRSETELLVTEVTKEIKSLDPTPYPSPNMGGTEGGVLLIDVGTGSGCIPISIMKTIKHENIKTQGHYSPLRRGRGGLANDWPRKNLTHPYPAQAGNGVPHSFGMTVMTTDISRPALRVAKKNAHRHGVNINFIHGNLLEPILQNYSLLPTPYSLIITANLPYLTAEQFKSEPSIQREPITALVADSKDGLSLYEKLFQQIQSLLLIANCYLLIAIEIDPRQVVGIKKLLRQYLPGFSVKIKKDLAGRERIAIISTTCHCEERSDVAIPSTLQHQNNMAISK